MRDQDDPHASEERVAQRPVVPKILSLDPDVDVAREGDVALVTIDRAERRNALTSDAARAVGDALEEAGNTSRAVILTGAGEAFCAGGDLEELERWSRLPAEQVGGVLYQTFQRMIRVIRAVPAIVIAAVNGPAVGAGMDLALACDLRVAAEGARFGQVWVRLGVIPGTGGAALTPLLAGPTKAAELLLTGHLIDAKEAYEAGLVNRVVPPETLLDEARTLAADILKHPRDGVTANKRAMVAATEDVVDAALKHAASVQPQRFTSEEFRRALAAARR